MTATDSVASPVNWKRHYFGAGYLTLSFVQDLTLFHEGTRGGGGGGGGVLNSAIDWEMFSRLKWNCLHISKSYAMWHRSCRNAFNTMKLDRIVKRKMPLVIQRQQTDMLNFVSVGMEKRT